MYFFRIPIPLWKCTEGMPAILRRLWQQRPAPSQPMCQHKPEASHARERVCVCVCASVCARDRDRERKKEGKKERERKRERGGIISSCCQADVVIAWSFSILVQHYVPATESQEVTNLTPH